MKMSEILRSSTFRLRCRINFILFCLFVCCLPKLRRNWAFVVFCMCRMIFVCSRTFVGFSGNFSISIKIFCESGQSMNDGKCYKRWPRSLASLLIVITCTFSILVHIKHISYRWQRCDWEWNFVILFILFFRLYFHVDEKSLNRSLYFGQSY